MPRKALGIVDSTSPADLPFWPVDLHVIGVSLDQLRTESTVWAELPQKLTYSISAPKPAGHPADTFMLIPDALRSVCEALPHGTEKSNCALWASGARTARNLFPVAIV
jgi:hypothetical protein